MLVRGESIRAKLLYSVLKYFGVLLERAMWILINLGL